MTDLWIVTEKHYACMRSLKALDYVTDRTKRAEKRQDGTCTWILQDTRYRQWRSADNTDISPVLWIDGGPGFGKSVITAFLAEEISKDESLVVAYFFCDDKDDRLNTGASILSHWLHQILRRIPETYKHFLSEHWFREVKDEKKDKVDWGFVPLCRVLERILSDHETPSIYLLVDALGKGCSRPILIL